MLGSDIDNMVVMPNGDLVVGGEFYSAGGVSANHIARWNGASWFALGDGVTDALGCSTGVVGTMGVLPSNELVISGVCSIGGTSTGSVAKWTGTSWVRLGNMDSGVETLAVLADGRIVAGGEFTTVNGVSTNHAAVWDGTSWLPLGGGVGNPGQSVYTLMTRPNGDILAGGHFSTAGAYAASNFARYAVATADFDGDGDTGTDADIEAFFACLSGSCCATCGTADFNADGDVGTDADIEAFFRVLAGGHC